MRLRHGVFVVLLLLGSFSAFSGEKIKPNFDEITLNGERITSWDNIAGYGWFGESVASKIGVPYFNNGAVTWDSLVEFLARAGVTYNPATDSWEFSAEIVSPQFGSNAADGEHFINVANSTAPTDNVAVGDCYYDNVALQWLCYDGNSWEGITASSTATFTNKTFDSGGTGNVLKIQSASNPTVDATENLGVDTTAGQLLYHDGTAVRVPVTEQVVSKQIWSPEDDIGASPYLLLYTRRPITVTALVSVIKGGSETPSATWTIYFDSTIAGTTTQVVTGGTHTTNSTTGTVTTSFNNASIPAERWVKLAVTAVGGTTKPDELNVLMYYTEDRQ